ncbi:MAG: hypothetical protein PR2021_0420 [Candidatus Phytoplasma pruni]|nr:MAG: hypothetical protein PR2021_0420 [Candidatus Phytoplasma pruni]
MLQKIFLLTLDNCVNCHQLKNILQKAYPQYLKHIQIITRQQTETFNKLVREYNIKKAPALINDNKDTILRAEKLDMIDAFLKENISLPSEEL